MLSRGFLQPLALIVGGILSWGLGLSACRDETKKEPVPMTRLHTDRTYIRDEYNRYVYFHGLNTSGSAKTPLVSPDGTFTYVGRPFPLDQARFQFARMRKMGFNSIRLVVIWEGLEPEQKGQYNQEYLDYLREIVKIAGEHDIYVLVDMHQDMFSRHLFVRYNEKPDTDYAQPGTLEASLLALLPPYTDHVGGDGAPRWVIQSCMPEKKLDSPNWGIARILSGIDENRADLITLAKRLSGNTAGSGTPEIPPWVTHFMDNLPPSFPPNESTDMLPFTNWGMAGAVSMDLERAYGCLFLGDVIFPGLEKDGVDIKEYLQDAYANAFAKLAETVGDLPNVMGYDLMNEPEASFLLLAAAAAAIQGNAQEGAKGYLTSLLGQETGPLIYEAILALRLIPPDNKPETLRLWGLDKLNLQALVTANWGFDRSYLTPFYDRIGQAILNVDPNAVIYIESSVNPGSFLGQSLPGGNWEMPMDRPPNLPQVVYAPHKYPDIYPYVGFNQPPRQFTPEEVRYRDYGPMLEEGKKPASYSLGNLPVVFGEFGTYFNFNGIENSKAAGYLVSGHVLDNYYEAFDRMFQSRILWCMSPDNKEDYGDSWNKEDFSIIDPNGNPRGEMAWARPFVRALAGKPISVHFWSDYHYFDPDKGKQMPAREFELKYASKETDAPTEITIPEVQYPKGFFVWVTDGQCYFDPARHVLYHYPEKDDPDAEYTIRVLPPLPNQVNEGWKYFFKGDMAISR